MQGYQRDGCPPCFTNVLFTTVKAWKQPQCQQEFTDMWDTHTQGWSLKTMELGALTTHSKKIHLLLSLPQKQRNWEMIQLTVKIGNSLYLRTRTQTLIISIPYTMISKWIQTFSCTSLKICKMKIKVLYLLKTILCNGPAQFTLMLFKGYLCMHTCTRMHTRTHIHTPRMLFSHERKQNPGIFNNVTGSWRHNVKCNKSEGNTVWYHLNMKS